MRTILIIFGLVLSYGQLMAQEISLTAQLHKDTVGFEEQIQVTFTVMNAQNVDFQPPKFVEFANATSTGTSSSFSFINGKTTQSVSYNYVLEHKGVGVYVIEKAQVELDGLIYESDFVEVVVIDEPATPDPITRSDNMNGIFQFEMPSFPDMPNLPDMEQFSFPDINNLEDLRKLFPNMPNLPDNGKPQPKEKKKKKVYKI